MTDRFLRACRLQEVDRTPVWFMRQAGRYMPEYRALRAQHSLLTLCRTPELAVQVTLQPIQALGVDAAILFSDLLLPLAPLGIPFDFQAGEGPVIEKPLRSRAEIDALRRFEPRQDLGMVLEAIRMLRRELEGKVPLIGFAGAPFTLASYAIEGGHSANFALTKTLMYTDPEAWHAWRASPTSPAITCAQVEAGAQALQIFDSWIGALDAGDYREYVLSARARSLRAWRARTCRHPLRHRPSTCSEAQREAGGNVIGLDWRTPLDEGWARLGLRVGSRATSIPRCCSGPGTACSRAWTTCCDGPPAVRVTSSTSGTASCPARPSRTSRP